MATEEGLVVRRDETGIWVKTVRTGACESCASRGSCHTLGGGGGKEVEVAVVDLPGTRVGDRVVLKMDTSPLLKATFLIYLVPILLLLCGAVAGQFLSSAAEVDSSTASAVLGFGALALGLFLVKTVGRRLSQKSAYRPRIVRVIGRTASPSQNP